MRPLLPTSVGPSTPARELDPVALRRAPALRAVDTRKLTKVAPELWVGAHFGDLLPVGRTLEQFASRARRFTPRVSLVPPDGLVLEVKGSLHLCNGVEGLLAALEAECIDVGMKPSLAMAPTPLAATVGARCAQPFRVDNKAQLVGQLSGLPLGPLRWPEESVTRLAKMVVRAIGQVLRLPRSGFARRFGAGQLAELDRLIGRNPDLRRGFEPR